MRALDATDGPAAVTAAATPLEVRGRFLTAAVLRVRGEIDDGFWAALDALLARSPQFFANAPLVLDLEEADGLFVTNEVRDLVDGLRARRLSPVGVQNASVAQKVAAVSAHLLSLPPGREAPLERKPEPAQTAPARVEAAPPPAEPPRAEPAPADPGPATLLVTEPVRSGQRLFAERGDLVVLASVGSGAELLARGNIHVYGALRGRALAGVDGDRGARIFCRSLEAELIAIAGLYRTHDDFGPKILRRRVQAFLRDDDLRIEPLG